MHGVSDSVVINTYFISKNGEGTDFMNSSYYNLNTYLSIDVQNIKRALNMCTLVEMCENLLYIYIDNDGVFKFLI
jgi:hypothetical protein